MASSILALTRYDRIGASSRVRFLQYLPYLERMGLRVSVEPLFSDDYVRRLYREGKRSPTELLSALGKRLRTILRHNKDDIVWLQQELFPLLPYAAEDFLLAGRNVVIDFDDAYHLYYRGLPSAIARWAYAQKIERLMRRASAVVVGSPAMAAYARDSGATNIHLVYSAVDAGRFARSGTPPADEFTVGWIGTPMTAAQSLHIVHDPLRQFLAETDAKCVFVGVDDNQFTDIKADRLAWSEATEDAFFPRISVGLCPLEDNAWSRGKSGYKIIQYMAAGRAALASPVGIAADLIEHGKTGYLCQKAEDWYTSLMALYRDSERCTAFGTQARAIAAKTYDSTLAAEQLYGIFRGLGA